MTDLKQTSTAAQCTILIPIFNAQAYLNDLITSIQQQTSSAWHCIFVNDGSTDTSLKILQDYAAAEKRFTVINQKNAGCGAARNTALNLVKTQYLMFADQDDILHPQAVETALNSISQTDIDCLLFGYKKFVHTPKIQPINNKYTPATTSRNSTTLITGKRDSWSIFVWRYIFKTSSVIDTPFPHISGGEDQAWMTELSWKNLKWAQIEPVLYFNRDNPLSQSRALSQNYINCVFYSYKWIKERAALYDIDPIWLEKFINHMAFMFKLSIHYRKITSRAFTVARWLRRLFCRANS